MIRPSQYFLVSLAESSSLPSFCAEFLKLDSEGQHAIHWAAQEQNLKAIQNIVNWGVDPCLLNSDGLTALDISLDNHFFEISDWLIENGETLEPRPNGFNSLDYPAMHDDTVAMKYLISKGAKINGSSGRASPLVWATQEHQLNAVKVLLRAGASPYLKDGEAHSAIEIASADGAMSLLSELIAVGPNSDVDRDSLRNALDLALLYDQLEAAEILKTR